MTRSAIAGILLVCAAALTAYAAVPTSITVQGKLTDAGGNPLSAGPKNFTFKIFDASVGGGQFWPDAGGENQVITTATDGTWVGLVGAVIPILLDAFADTSRWLEITVDGITLPRVRLVTGPYAYRVGTVDGASGGTITSKVAIGEGHFNVGFHTFVAGFDNNVDGDFTSVTGGRSNSATGQFSHISGGENDTASGNHSTVGGGLHNRATQLETTIGGGRDNLASGFAATIAGGRENQATATEATVGGGQLNIAGGSNATIGGGQENTATAFAATIAGGYQNNASGGQSVIGGGEGNIAAGLYSSVLSGFENRSTAEGAVIAGGAANRASGIYSFVGGGGGALPDSNAASGSWSSVVGGSHNVASGLTAFVGGGSGNIAKSGSAAIVGGQNNRADTGSTFIGGGRDNHVDQVDAVIGGGWMNEALGNTSAILGGRSNVASGAGSAIVGGVTNRARGAFSFVGGGGGTTATDSNLALGDLSTIAGGRANLATGAYSVVGGGQNNAATQLEANVGGGNGNRATGIASTVAGGRSDTAAGSFSTVGGGIRNRANDYATVAGGMENRAIGNYATIGGGNRNFAEFASTIAGGQFNTASATNGASIVGGVQNTADGSFSFIGGGYHNQTYGDLSTIGGGGGSSDIDSNVTRGLCATIPGGRRNRANGSFSFAAGRRAHALHHGTFVWADSTEADFVSTAQDQFLIRASGGVGIGTNAPEGPWHVQKGSAGAVTANSNSIAVFETSASNGWLSILGPDNAERGLLFTEPSSAVAGAIVFDQGGGGDDIGFRTGGNVTRMTLDASGNLTVSGCVDGNNTACASDERFKTNIATVDDALALVGRLRGVRYEWRREEFPDHSFDAGAQYGVIAQEVREVLPEVVRERADGYLSVEYNALIPLLIEGMKEQQRQIDELKAALRALTP